MIGEKNNRSPEEHSGTGVVTEANEDRTGLLDKLFGVMPNATSVEKALINQNFATPEGERRTAHSPLLQKKVASRHVVDQPTLTESVRRVVGRV